MTLQDKRQVKKGQSLIICGLIEGYNFQKDSIDFSELHEMVIVSYDYFLQSQQLITSIIEADRKKRAENIK